MNILINLPENANTLINDRETCYFLNAEVSSDQISVTLGEENLSACFDNYISFPLPCEGVENVEYIAGYFAERVEDLLNCGSLILDDNNTNYDNQYNFDNQINSGSNDVYTTNANSYQANDIYSNNNSLDILQKTAGMGSVNFNSNDYTY